MKTELLVATRAVVREATARDLDDSLRARRGVVVRDASDGGPEGLVFLELEPEQGRDMAYAARVLAMDGVGEVVLLVDSLDRELLLEAMRAGVREVLELPLDPDVLDEVLDRYRDRRGHDATRRSARSGRVLDVVGAKGGVGATTVAVNLAMSLHKLAGRDGKTALVEMNPAFGDISMFMDIDPLYHWGEAVRNIDRLDATYLMSIMTRHESGLYVLPSPSLLEAAVDVTPMAMERLFSLLREVFEFTVVDGGSYLDEFSFNVMAESTQVLVVADLSLPCLAKVKRLRESVQQLGTVEDERLLLVFNRHLSSAELSVDEAEELMGVRPFWLIPNDYRSTLAAINQGKALCEAAPKAPVTRALARMSGVLADNRKQGAAHGKGGGWSPLKLFRKDPGTRAA